QVRQTLLLRQLLLLHVGPDPLRHLGRADGLGAHDVFERVAAALEVDRVATERHLLLRHSGSSVAIGCGGPRCPAPPHPAGGDYGRTPRGRKAKNTTRGGVPTRENYREGVSISEGGFTPLRTPP